MKTIDRSELASLIDSDTPPVVLEALPEPYFPKGHLPRALLFPHDQASALAPRLLGDPAARIVVYCASDTCKNSHVAAETLAELGYQDVRVYLGGKQDWQSAGLPLER